MSSRITFASIILPHGSKVDTSNAESGEFVDEPEEDSDDPSCLDCLEMDYCISRQKCSLNDS